MAKTWSRKRIRLEDLDLSYFDGRTAYDHGFNTARRARLGLSWKD